MWQYLVSQGQNEILGQDNRSKDNSRETESRGCQRKNIKGSLGISSILCLARAERGNPHPSESRQCLTEKVYVWKGKVRQERTKLW